MKRQSIALLLLFLLGVLVSCSPGHVGGNEIAFVRDGHLWTIDPDGSNAFEVAADSTPVVGYGWSPNHQIFVFRTLDADFAKTAAGRHIRSSALTGLVGDVPSGLNTIGIDGGSAIPIIPSSSDISYSNAWWNVTGNRLLYREELADTKQSPGTVSWWISQNDQPDGIARKILPVSYSIPSLSSASNNAMAIGNFARGVFTTTLAGTDMHYVISGALPGHPLPAALERVLWQPGHSNPDILYAVPTPSQPFITKSAALQVQLVLRDPDGHKTMIATCDCIQFAWSPDGNSVLYSTGTNYTILNVASGSSFNISDEAGSVSYWSPDSRFLLLDGLHTLMLVQVATKQQQFLLSDSTPAGQPGSSKASEPGSDALLQPVSNSLWATDSLHFLFLSRGRLIWQGGHRLSSGGGLYTAVIDGQGKLQGTPAIVESGNDEQAGWSYEDPNTSFLF